MNTIHQGGFKVGDAVAVDGEQGRFVVEEINGTVLTVRGENGVDIIHLGADEITGHHVN